ncbi:helix-turn-helix domain-containing protein [Halococcus agarilyticus]|uniref:helix-turn-helix domain-containing protein n=1 Tax=Halococcus agarilyticus TaxID=1232219 RepID=UPI000677E784|nr:helix-turn-helix domain-containing protein [Halococcus agarilyticus]
MSVIARISLPAGGFELGQVFTGTAAEIELSEFVAITDDPLPHFWVTNFDGDIESFEATVRDDPIVGALTRLNGLAGKVLYEIEWADGVDGFLTAIATNEIIVEWATGTAEEWTFALRAGDREALSSFYDDCLTHDVPVTVKEIHPEPEEPDEPQFGLSAKQHEAVTRAFEAGYYEVPRTTSLTELGTATDISRQAFARRLNRGTHRVFANTVMLDS